MHFVVDQPTRDADDRDLLQRLSALGFMLEHLFIPVHGPGPFYPLSSVQPLAKLRTLSMKVQLAGLRAASAWFQSLESAMLPHLQSVELDLSKINMSNAPSQEIWFPSSSPLAPTHGLTDFLELWIRPHAVACYTVTLNVRSHPAITELDLFLVRGNEIDGPKLKALVTYAPHLVKLTLRVSEEKPGSLIGDWVCFSGSSFPFVL